MRTGISDWGVSSDGDLVDYDGAIIVGLADDKTSVVSLIDLN